MEKPKPRTLPEILKALSSSDRAFVDFVMKPLGAVAREKGMQPRTLEEAAQLAGHPSFDEYLTGCNRLWMTMQLEAGYEKTKKAGDKKRKDEAIGQASLF